MTDKETIREILSRARMNYSTPAALDVGNYLAVGRIRFDFHGDDSLEAVYTDLEEDDYDI